MTDAKARLLQMIADEPHMAGGGLLKAVSKAQKVAKKAETGARAILPAAERDANLAKMMESSKVKGRLYHGTTAHDDYADAPGQAFQQFTGQPTWLAKEPYTASGYAKGTGSVYPVHAQVKKPMTIGFDANDSASKAFPLAKRLGVDVDHMVSMRKPESAWEVVNDPAFVEAAMNAGHDAFLMNEGGYPTYGVFDPAKIKSAIGNRGTYDLSDPDITKAGGGAVHMAGGGTHWSMGNPEQFVKNKSERLYPKLERMNPAVKAVKNQVDAFNRLVDQGVPIKDLVGGLVGAVPFVGPDMRKRMEGATLNFPTGFERSKTNPQVATGRIDAAPAKVSDILGELKPSDFTGTKGMSNVLGDVGRGYAPNVLDVLDTLGMDITGFGGVGIGTAIKGGRKAAGALSDLAKSETGYKLAQKVINSPYMAPMSMNVVKDTGGNWLSGTVEQALKPLKRGNYDIPQYIRDDLAIEDLTPQELAINKWIDSNLTNYVKKQMATPGDPVRKLAEEGISHMPQLDVPNRSVPEFLAVKRMEAGQAPLGIGKSNAAKGWETATDYRLNVAPAKEYTKPLTESEIRRGFSSAVNTDPWLTKLDPDTPVFHAADADSFARGLGFDHIVDVLNQDLAAGRIRPEQLNKISMEQAVRRTYEFDQDMAKKMRETQAKVTEGMPVHKEYPEGYKWVELTSPKKELPSGWSVKEALNPMSGKQFQVFDENGSPIAGAYGKTEESALGSATKQLGRPELEQALRYEGDTMGHCVGGYCPDVLEGRSRIFSLRDAKGEPHVTIEVQPHTKGFTNLLNDDVAQQVGAEQIGRIVQIKGKQNRAPKEEYLPFVQDFVKGGNWSEVGDIKNAGLRRTSDAFNENELNKIREAGIEVPAYATQEEIKSIGNQAFPDFGNVFYAEGGEVKSFFEEKSAKQRLLDMIAEEPHMNNGVRPSRLQLQGEIANDTYGGIGGGGRATYTHPVGSDAAIRAYMEGGGYKPKDEPYKGQVKNMGISYEKEFNEGGEANMARGGVLKAIETAQKTAKKSQMYSAVDKALEASKRGAGTGMEFANELAKTSGIKKAELVDRGIMVPSKNGPVLNPALTQLPKMSKQDFVSHLNEKYKPPGVRKITLGNVKFDQLSDQDLYNEYFRIRGSGPEAYGERMSREDILDELSGVPEEDATKAKYSQYKLPGSENYRENLYQYENPTGKAFYQSHFDEPNVLYHMRQADRIEPTYTSEQIYGIGQRMAEAMGTKVENLGSGAPILMMRKGVISPLEAAQFAHAKGFQNMDIDMTPAQRRALHIEEIQSDWHQKGRDKGYKQVQENVYDKEYDSYIQDLKSRYFERLKETYAPGEADPVKASFEIRRNMTPEADPQKIAETMGELDTLQDKFAAMYRERQAENVGVPDAPLKKNWHEHAIKQALMDAVEGDYDQLLITPGAKQAERYSLKNMLDSLSVGGDQNGIRQVSWMPVGQRTDMALKFDKNGVVVQSMLPELKDKHLSDVFGKEMAEKIMGAEPYQRFEGLDLEVGGKGMEGFYDKMLPSYLNDLGKKYGVRVGERAIEGETSYAKTLPTLADIQRLGRELYGAEDVQAISALSVEQRNALNDAFANEVRAANTTKLHSFDITPEMREDILNNGLSMYQRGGEVHMGRGGILGAISKAQDTSKAAEKAAEAAAKAAKVDHPLVFPRAAAKTINDIRPIAQRMADQMTGNFVKQNPKVTTNPAGKSRKQFERERNMPLETRNVVPERPAPDVNYEDYMGYGLVGVPGDPTMGGVAKRGSLEATAQPTVELTRVGDITPDYPVPLFGGPRYGDDEKFWASNFTAAVPIQKNASKLADKYESPILAKYIKMGSGSENFALHNLDALLSIQRPEKLDKAKMAQLTEAIQAGSPKYGKFPGFTGFKDPADVLLQAQMDSNLRKHIAETLTKPTITDQLGLPNGLDVVAAITYPELRNLETGASGFSVGKMKPGAELQRGQSSHPTYDTDIPGSFLGRSRYPTPYEIAFPDTTAYARSKMTPGVQEFNMMKMLGPRERIDQQYIDEIKMYEQLMKQYTGKKKGGLAHSKKVKRHGNTVPH